jgi:GTP-binding protein
MGQVIGENTRQNDITVNITKTKKLTNMRASGSDDKAILAPPVRFSLEEAMEYIARDEYIEVTPKSMRIRKILLNEIDRKRVKNTEQDLNGNITPENGEMVRSHLPA